MWQWLNGLAGDDGYAVAVGIRGMLFTYLFFQLVISNVDHQFSLCLHCLSEVILDAYGVLLSEAPVELTQVGLSLS